MTEKLTGEIQNIKKDRKALAINNIWYSSNFKPLSEDLKKGDNVEIEYQTKGQFHNLKSIKKLEPNWSKEIDSDYKSNNEKSNLTSTDLNCIIMTAKDLAIEFKDVPFREWVNEVKKIRLNL